MSRRLWAASREQLSLSPPLRTGSRRYRHPGRRCVSCPVLAGHAGSPTSGRVRRQPPIEAGCRTACRTGRPGTAISPLVTPSALDCDNAHRGVTGPKTGHQVGTCTPTGASMNVGNCGPRAADTTRDGGFPRRIRGGRSLSLGDRCCRASVPPVVLTAYRTWRKLDLPIDVRVIREFVGQQTCRWSGVDRNS